jgi:hypothetical protein
MCSYLFACRISRSLGSYSDIDTVIGEDEGGVTGCEFGGRHLDCLETVSVLGSTELQVQMSMRDLLTRSCCVVPFL